LACGLSEDQGAAGRLRSREKTRRVWEEAASYVFGHHKIRAGTRGWLHRAARRLVDFNPSSTRSLRSFASPLFLVAMSIIYGVFFMILLALNYEYHLHHPNDPHSYTRFQYTRNQSLGFGALVCFCISYMWLIAAATK
jgi:hypothetical protein